VLLVYRGDVPCILQIHALIECEFRLSGHIQKSEDFESIQEELTSSHLQYFDRML